jgi:hypothetical protein
MRLLHILGWVVVIVVGAWVLTHPHHAGSIVHGWINSISSFAQGLGGS